jgi:hypothetical protein
MNIANLDHVIKSVEARPIGYFESYDNENLMNFESLKVYEELIESKKEGVRALTMDQSNDMINKLNVSDSELKISMEENEKTKLLYDDIFGLFDNDSAFENVLEVTEIEELKLVAFKEIIEELLQDNLTEFLDGEKPVSEASLKEYYRELFGVTEKKKTASEILSTSTNEFLNFKKIFKRFNN